MKKINNLLYIIFPKRCIICNRVIHAKEFCCKQCVCRLPFINFAKINKNHIFCNNINIKNISLFYYKGIVKKLLQEMKFNGKKQLAYEFSNLLSHFINEKYKGISFDCVIPVPIHEQTLKTRRFNQSEILCVSYCKEYKVPLIKNILIKNKITKSQHSLNKKERQTNLNSAFNVEDHTFIKDKTILLIDDILTTGATLSECIKELINAGAKDVYTATVAYTNASESIDFL